MANKYMKKHLTSLDIKEMHMKTTLRFPPSNTVFSEGLAAPSEEVSGVAGAQVTQGFVDHCKLLISVRVKMRATVGI
jgi:hypothetical protein